MHSRVLGRWLGFAAVAALIGLPEAAAQDPSPPEHFAITNARIVIGNGQTIETGTVVMKNGLITAVGRNPNVPAAAWVIDGSGFTVYPGLVDAMSGMNSVRSRRARLPTSL